MKCVYLHVGVGKTGTKAIQTFLTINRDFLLKDGICYPKFDNRSDHYALYSLLLKNNISEVKDLMNRYKNYLVMILSSEFFFTIPRKCCLFKEYFDQVKIIIYLRRQDHWIESAYQQFVKLTDQRGTGKAVRGAELDFQEGKKVFLDHANWYKTLDLWGILFDKQSIIVRPYEKEQFIGGSIFSDLLNIIGRKFSDEYKLPNSKQSNISFNQDAVELLRLSNMYQPKDAEPIAYRLLADLGPVVRKREGEGYDFLSRKERIELLEKYEPSNQAVAREYLGREDGRLFCEPWPEPDEKEEPYKLSLERVVPILMQLILNLYLHQGQFENMVNQLSNQLLKKKGDPKEIKQYAPISAAEAERLHQGTEAVKRQLNRSLSADQGLQRKLTQVRQELFHANQQLVTTRNQLHAIENTLTWKISRAVISEAEKVRILSKVLQLLRRKMNSISMLK